MRFCHILIAIAATIRFSDVRCEEPLAAIPAFPRVAPTEPERAGATFQTLHGFEMQLLAAEPLIADPVDVAYDEDGRAYVVEMRDYPYPEEKGAVPTEFPGRVTLLEDRDGDGAYDTSHPFADKLSWPTSVACWKGGVFVAAAPDIWYFRDEDGDHRAEVRRRVFTGFSRDNVQAIMNGLRWGLDNRIYGAASGNGGSILPAPQAAVRPITVTRHDFRFDPATEQFEAIPGGARFGNSFDDWGNRFVCNIRNPVQQVMLSERYFGRNPLFAAPSPIRDAAESGDQLPVYRISPPELWRVFRAQRWSAERVNFPRSELLGAGYWTSSSGITVYRGSAYPPEFHGNVFVGEVAGNLVHRQTLTLDGVTYRSRRADPNAEFVASKDIWFRPVNFVNAPDGTLHVLDMYREAIEHPWSIPDDIKAKLDLRSGNDRGRIYRLAPQGFRAPQPPRLSSSTIPELVVLLEHPNAWHRETAQRLLFERRRPESVEPVRRMLRESKSAVGRLHAMHLLAGLGALRPEDLLRVLSDPEPQLRRHAVQLAEASLSDSGPLRDRIHQLAEDDSAIVRFQVALTLGERRDEPSAKGLARIAARDSADEWLRAAVLSSSGAQPLVTLTELLRTPENAQREGMPLVLRELAYYAAASNVPDAAAAVLELLGRLPSEAGSSQFALVAGLGLGLQRHQKSFASLEKDSSAEGVRRLHLLREQARRMALDGAAATDARLAALELFRFATVDEAVGPLSECLVAREPLPIQLAAVRLLRHWPAPAVASVLAKSWKACSAGVRLEIVEALLSRGEWSDVLLGALERGEIVAGQLAIPQRSRLVNSTVLAVKERAVKLLGPEATSARGDVVREFRAALDLAANPARGEPVFRRECSTCHRLGSVGYDVGPNLNTIRHRSAEEVLVHLFDPNRDVPPQYISHTVQLRDGRVLTGLIVAETDSSVELQRAENVRETVVRRDIEAIVSSEKSIMPEGLELKVSRQEVADLLSFLLSE